MSRSRLITRIVYSASKTLLPLLAVALLIAPASAAADPQYSVMNAPEGVYWRSEPNWAAAERVSGFGVYNGTVIEVHCYQSGTTVEGSNDTMWEQATDVGGPGYGSGWLNEHFINDGQPINQPSPGVPPCGSSPAPTPAPSPAPGSPAPGSGGLVFPIFNAEGGIYYRYGPHWNETTSTPGVGVYDGDTVEIICGAFGDPIGPYSDTAWSYVNNLSRPVGDGWVNEHFINDGAPDNGFVAGEPICQPGSGSNSGGGSSAGGGGSGSGSGSGGSPAGTSFNRGATVAWAKAHARDTPPSDSACTWFVSQALWAGGLPDSSATAWNSFGSHAGVIRHYPGSLTAWSTPLFVEYILRTFPHSTYTQLDVRAGHTDVPAAQPGDVILYSWDGKSTIKNKSDLDHASLVMWDAPHSKYPEVSEWGADDFLAWGRAVNYISRGWTWSQVNHEWLQNEDGNSSMKAFLLHIDTTG